VAYHRERSYLLFYWQVQPLAAPAAYVVQWFRGTFGFLGFSLEAVGEGGAREQDNLINDRWQRLLEQALMTRANSHRESTVQLTLFKTREQRVHQRLNNFGIALRQYGLWFQVVGSIVSEMPSEKIP
jgi:hypothetical protein